MDKRAGGLQAILVWERLDEHVRDDEEDGHDDGDDYLREKHSAPVCAGDVV